MAELTPLSVWPVAQQLPREQRRDRYLPESSAHPGKMLPALAREAIRRYSQPGDLVLDPMCGIGTTLAGYLTALGAEVVGVARSAGERDGYRVVTPDDLPEELR